MIFNDKEAPKTIEPIAFFCIMLFCIYSYFEWEIINGYDVKYFDFLKKGIFLFHKDILLFKVCFTILFYILVNFRLTKKDWDFGQKAILIILFLVFSVPFFAGYIFQNSFYSYIGYPLMFSIFCFFLFQISRMFGKELKEEDMIIDKVSSSGENLFSITFLTNLGKLVVNNARAGLIFIGGMGSGKTKAIENVIHQLITKGFTMVIYEYEGDPMLLNVKGEKPLGLTRLAYQTLMENQEVDEEGNVKFYYYESSLFWRKKKVMIEKPLNFEFINFTDPLRTKKYNTFNPIYHKDKFSIASEAKRFLLAADPGLEKGDGFWNENAFVIGESIAEILLTEFPHLCTVPHWVTIITSDTEVLLEWLNSFDGYKHRAVLLLGAYKEGGSSNKQLISQISSAQKPLGRLFNDIFFWVANPKNSKEEVNLNINSHDYPTVLCIGNSTKLQENLKAPIATILSNVISNLDIMGQRRSAMIIDEYATTKLNASQLANFMAVCRKKGVVSVLGYQIQEQGEDNYGKIKQTVIEKSFNNRFVFRGRNMEIAKELSEVFGKRKVKNLSLGKNDGSGSSNTSLVAENRVNVGDILNQKTGHVTGNIIDGKPSIFHAQLGLFNKEVVQDLPYQCNPEYLTGISEETDRAIVKSLMQENMLQIREEVKEILSDVTKMIEERKKIEEEMIKFTNKNK